MSDDLSPTVTVTLAHRLGSQPTSREILKDTERGRESKVEGEEVAARGWADERLKIVLLHNGILRNMSHLMPCCTPMHIRTPRNAAGRHASGGRGEEDFWGEVK